MDNYERIELQVYVKVVNEDPEANLRFARDLVLEALESFGPKIKFIHIMNQTPVEMSTEQFAQMMAEGGTH